MANWWDNLFGAGLGAIFGPLMNLVIIVIAIAIICVVGYFVIRYLWHKNETEGEQKQRLEMQQKMFDQALQQTQQLQAVTSTSPAPAQSQPAAAPAAPAINPALIAAAVGV